jgi:hypothetical protein
MILVPAGLGGAGGQAAELLAAGREGLEEQEDPPDQFVLHEARVVAAVLALLVSHDGLRPVRAFIGGDRDHQVVAGLVGAFVATLGDGDEGPLLGAEQGRNPHGGVAYVLLRLEDDDVGAVGGA